MSGSDELILLERVFLRVGSANTDEQLENSVSKFLPPVLLKLSSPNEAVRNKVMELLAHINKRIKNRSTIQIPVEALLVQYQDPSASAFITNFTIIYIKLGFPRLPVEKQSQLLPTLIHAAEGKPIQHQESLLFLLIGALGRINLPKSSAEAKSFLGLSEKPKLSKLLLSIVLDLLLIPCGWTSENPPPELSVNAYERAKNNFQWLSTPEKLEQMKMTLIKFLSCGMYSESETLVHLVVATGDSRSTVSNAGDMQLRKILSDIDFDSTSTVFPLYAVFLGSGEGDTKRNGASTRLKLKLLPQMSRSKAIVWPAAIKVLFVALYGENTNSKLRSLGLTFCSSIIHHIPVEELSKVASVILESGLVKLAEEPGDPTLRRQAYSVMGLLVSRVPSLANFGLLKELFLSLSKEQEGEVQSSLRDSMTTMRSAFERTSDDAETTPFLVRMLDSPSGKCRTVALRYIAEALPRSPSQVYTLVSASAHRDEDVASEAKKALYGPNYKTDGSLVLPSFEELLLLVVEKEKKKKADPKLRTEMLFYLRLCLASSAGAKASLTQLEHPCESSADIGEYLRSLHERDPLALVGYTDFAFALLDAQVGPVPLSCLVECVGCLPDVLVPKLALRSSLIKASIRDTKEEVRCLAAQLVGLLGEDGTVEELTEILRAGGKALEGIHGALLALGHFCERSARLSDTRLADPAPVIAIAKYLDHSHPMIVRSSCSALALIGQVQGLPLPDSDKQEITDKLLSILLVSKHSFKVKDKACSALASLCVGEDFSPRENIMNKLLDSAREIRAIELHLSSGDVIVNAVLGESSRDRCDPWSRVDDNATIGRRSEELASTFLARAFSLIETPHPHIRQSFCFWLLAVTKRCDRVEAVRSSFRDIQAAFMDFLSDNNGLVQEAAGKGLALVYQNGDADLRSELLGKVVERLTSGKRSVNRVASDTKLFEEGELGKAPTGGNLTTYKELCSLASDLNKPDLIYEFMHLVNHNAIWNSKKGAAYGVGSLVSLAGEELEVQLPNIVAKLYRYQYDPTPSVQQAMTSIWHSITASSSNTVEKYHKEIFDDLLTNLTSPQWRVRISCCHALSDFIRGGGSKIFEDRSDRVPELWKQLFRVMDDIHEGTREAATNTTKILSKICVRRCGNDLRKSGAEISSEILPVLMNVGIKHNVSEIRAVSVATVSEIVRGGVPPELVPPIVVALLNAAAELESTSLNAFSVALSSSARAHDAVESLRASAVKSHFAVQTLERVVRYVGPDMMDGLAPDVVEMLRSSVGLGSRVAASHFLILLSHHLTPDQMRPYVGKFLGALVNGLTDRNAAIRKTCATTIGQLTRCAKDSSVDRLITKLSSLYFDREDDSSRSAVCYTLQAMVNYSQDATKSRPDLVLPLVFFAKHQEKKIDGSDKNIVEAWEEIWDDVCTSAGIMLQNEEQICDTLELCMRSQAWRNKAQSARAIRTLGVKVGDRLSEERRDKLTALLLSGLSGRTWEGKECLLDALSAMCKHSPSLRGSERETVIEAVMKESKKEKIEYKIRALDCLAEILRSLGEDRFGEVYEMVLEIIKKDVDNEEKDKTEALTETAYATLGKVWPENRSTQDKYSEDIISQLSGSLGHKTRSVEVAIVSALGEMVDKLEILRTYPVNDGDALRLANILRQLNKAIVYSFGIAKHTKLRKEALNLLMILTKRLRGTNEAEYLKLEEIFWKFSEEIGRDNAPEIKSRFFDLKESFQQYKK